MSSDIRATYEISGEVARAKERALSLAVEQTHEFPPELAPVAAGGAVGRVLGVEVQGPELARAELAYPADVAGGELPQLLVVLFGNCSLLPGVRLVGVELPPETLAAFRGPRFGVAGLRGLLAAPTRPLLATALKPIGLDARSLASIAYEFAIAGIDVIKEDQSLANQRWAPFEERVRLCADAVRRANDETGGHAVYVPALNFPVDLLEARISIALEAGAGGFLALPGVTGFELMRKIAGEVPVPIFAHPTLLGSFLSSPGTGISHGLLLGELMRLAGADASIFPNHGGRFAFSAEQCLEISEGCRRPIGPLAPIFPAPGGGMSLARAPEMIEFYGPDVMLLIGGELHRGDRTRNAARFRELVDGL